MGTLLMPQGGGGGNGGKQNPALNSGNERSTKVLVGIVVVFLVCHIGRLVIQIDSIVHPSTMGSEHFLYCHNRGQLHSPYAVYILTSFNNLCLVLNSSINFVVYCMAGRSFRTTLLDLLCHVGLTRTSHEKRCQSHQPRRTTQIELTTVNIDISTAKTIPSKNSINDE